MLTLERNTIEPAARPLDKADRARLHAWLDLGTQRRPAAAAQAPDPQSPDAKALRWLPLVVPLLALLVAATVALIWAAVL